jgi:hypothetical protein
MNKIKKESKIYETSRFNLDFIKKELLGKGK